MEESVMAQCKKSPDGKHHGQIEVLRKKVKIQGNKKKKAKLLGYMTVCGWCNKTLVPWKVSPHQ